MRKPYRLLQLKLWGGDRIEFRARLTNVPPRASGYRPRLDGPATYYAARVCDGSGTEPAGMTPLEVWVLPDGLDSPGWDSVSNRSRSTKGAPKPNTQYDTMFHMWRWKDGETGNLRTFLLPATKIRYV